MGQLMWGRVLPSDSTQNAMEVSVLQSRILGTLKENFRGCDWRCNGDSEGMITC
jgi:hypothetical protein